MKSRKPSLLQIFSGFAALVVIGLVVGSQTTYLKSEVETKDQSATVSRVPTMKAELPPVIASTHAQPMVPVTEQPKVASDAPVAWQLGNLKASTPSIPLSEKISAYAVVELQRPEHLPVAGEQIQLPMLNGKILIADVQANLVNNNGDYTWSGHLQGYGTDYPIVMTYGEHSIFATVTTPEGSYSLESVDGLGWLYKNPAEVEMSTAGAKDFVEVDASQ